MALPRKILEYGIDGKMNRLTVLDKMGKSPSSSATRTLIVTSSKYGLTSGSYSASSLTVTKDGRVVSADHGSSERTQKMFDLAIKGFTPFNVLYEKLRGNRLPDASVLRDELGHAGIEEQDRERAAEIFVANVRYVELVQKVNGVDFVREIEDAMGGICSSDSSEDDVPSASVEPDGNQEQTKTTNGTRPANGKTVREPSLHIDVQVHIDATASAEQIDQIFASMAKHLYGRAE